MEAKKIIFSSFGFKYGMPQDANYVFDVRFAANPFYVEELKPLTGMDESVRDYIWSFGGSKDFLASAVAFLDMVIPQYLSGGRESIHTAVGCTGGRHRSVAFAWWLYDHYKRATPCEGTFYSVELFHRDMGRPEA